LTKEKPIVNPVPILIDIFPGEDFKINLLKEAIPKDGVWVQKTELGWTISGIGFLDREIVQALLYLLLDGSRLMFNLGMYCLDRMGNKVKDRVSDTLVSYLQKYEIIEGLIGQTIWLLGYIGRDNAKEILVKKMSDVEDIDLRFEYARAIARIEKSVIGFGFIECERLSKLEDSKWLAATEYLRNEIQNSIESGISSQHSEFSIIDKTLFISYTKGYNIVEWIEEFATELQKNGIYVYWDEWNVDYSERFTEFMNNIEKANFTALIITNRYLEKMRKSSGGVSYEKKIIDAMIERGIGEKRLIIIIKQKNAKNNLPLLYKSMKYFDMTTKKKYNNEIQNLIKFVYGKSKPKRPPLGSEPAFAD
jgi:hypothetical protein